MKLFKKSSQPSGRQRQSLRSQDASQPGAFSYYARRSDYDFNTGRQMQRDEMVAQKRESRFKRSSRIKHLSAFGVTLVILTILTSLKTAPILTTPTVSQNKYAVLLQPSRVYEQAASDSLNESLLNRNKSTLRSKDVARALLDEFPEIGSVNVSSSLFSNRPNVVMSPVEPALLLSAGNGVYVVDRTGTAIVNAANVKDLAKLHLPTVQDQAAGPVKVKDQVLTSGEVAFMKTVVAELSAKEQSVSKMTLLTGAAELDVKTTGQPYTVKFNLHSPTARQQTGTYLAVQASLAAKQITPEYIDVRVPGRAYYK